jgi:hypothetical protein
MGEEEAEEEEAELDDKLSKVGALGNISVILFETLLAT